MAVTSPWSDDTVARLNAHQTCGFLHPYTCGNCSADLVATRDGWVCAGDGCSYTQNWAHDPPKITDLEAMKNSLFKIDKQFNE